MAPESLQPIVAHLEECAKWKWQAWAPMPSP